jgi:predicted secreted protein
MGDILRGRYASIKKGSSTVANMSRWSLDIRMDQLEATVFGSSAWKKKLSGLQEWSATLEGFYDPADTAGQAALKVAALAGDKITDLKLYIDSTSYWVPDITTDSGAGCYITAMPIDNDASGLVKVTYNVAGYGPLTLV